MLAAISVHVEETVECSCTHIPKWMGQVYIFLTNIIFYNEYPKGKHTTDFNVLKMVGTMLYYRESWRHTRVCFPLSKVKPKKNCL
jgi:hypothetical protein